MRTVCSAPKCHSTEADSFISLFRCPKDPRRFPVEDVKLKEWIKLLGFSSEKFVPKRAEICSDHFNLTDFQVKSSGRFLAPFAQPLPFQPLLDEIPGNIPEDDNTPIFIDNQHMTSTSIEIYPESPIIIETIPKTPAQCHKEYLQRKKNKANSDGLQRIKKIPKTTAQRQKEYRERQKNKAKSDSLQRLKKIPKTTAQRQKEYRERQKNKANSDNLHRIKKMPKTTAQRQKEYRERQKHKLQNQLSQLDDLLFEKEEIASYIKQEKLDNIQDETREKIITTDVAIPANHTQQSILRCRQWKNRLGFVGDHRYANLTPEQSYGRIKVCSLHFKEDDFCSERRNRIKKNALPSLLLGYDPETEQNPYVGSSDESEIDGKKDRGKDVPSELWKIPCISTQTDGEMRLEDEAFATLPVTTPREVELMTEIRILKSRLEAAERRENLAKTITTEFIKFVEDKCPPELVSPMKAQLALLEETLLGPRIKSNEPKEQGDFEFVDASNNISPHFIATNIKMEAEKPPEELRSIDDIKLEENEDEKVEPEFVDPALVSYIMATDSAEHLEEIKKENVDTDCNMEMGLS